MTPDAGHWDPIWESIFSSRPWGKYPAESIVRAVMRQYGRVTDRAALRALDVGCGPGANAWFLAREGFDVSGIDGSATAIDLARSRLESEGLTADLRVGDFTQSLPWADATFDFAVDCAAMYANPPQGIRAAIQNIHRALKPGGMFVSLAFTDQSWGYGTGVPSGHTGGFTEVAEGPLAGTGYVQYLGRAAVDDLYGAFARRTLERTSYTMENMERVIDLWVVVAWRGDND
jgi:SAM-dependent methyltransferase